MLCQLCEGLKFDCTVFGNSQHYSTWDGLVKSARSGCELCSLILEVERDLGLTAPFMDFDGQAASLGPILYNFTVQAFLAALNVHIPSPPAITKCLVRFSLFQFDSAISHELLNCLRES
jgi:hypothetical protein